VQERAKVRIALREILDEVGSKADDAVLISLGTADEDHSLCGEETEVDRVSSMCAAHGDRHMLLSSFPGHCVPFAENTQPPAVVASAIGPRGTVMRPHRKVDATSRFQELLGDLGARRARSHDQYGAFRELS